MKKHLRTILTGCLVGGMLLGASVSATAEPAATPATETIELALRGPDRTIRAPQRAVKAPVARPAPRREKEITPPPPSPKPFVYEKKECKTLTNTPYDINAPQHHSDEGPAIYHFDRNRVHMFSSTDRYVHNKLGAMGADREFMRLEFCERLGVWANGRIAGQSPRTLVSEMTDRLRGLTCGTWTKPTEVNMAGVPVTMATGYDEFGNYFYEVIAFERWGNTYAFATRTPYKSRYHTGRNAELAYLVTHIHPSNWVE